MNTYADYVALESVSPEKHEFLNGEIYVIPGGTENHSKLSVNTESKLEYYRTIPTLREYLIVSHRKRRITVHARESNGAWSTRVFDGANVDIPSLNAQLSLDEIYRGTTISAD